MALRRYIAPTPSGHGRRKYRRVSSRKSSYRRSVAPARSYSAAAVGAPSASSRSYSVRAPTAARRLGGISGTLGNVGRQVGGMAAKSIGDFIPVIGPILGTLVDTLLNGGGGGSSTATGRGGSIAMIDKTVTGGLGAMDSRFKMGGVSRRAYRKFLRNFLISRVKWTGRMGPVMDKMDKQIVGPGTDVTKTYYVFFTHGQVLPPRSLLKSFMSGPTTTFLSQRYVFIPKITLTHYINNGHSVPMNYELYWGRMNDKDALTFIDGTEDAADDTAVYTHFKNLAPIVVPNVKYDPQFMSYWRGPVYGRHIRLLPGQAKYISYSIYPGFILNREDTTGDLVPPLVQTNHKAKVYHTMWRCYVDYGVLVGDGAIPNAVNDQFGQLLTSSPSSLTYIKLTAYLPQGDNYNMKRIQYPRDNVAAGGILPPMDKISVPAAIESTDVSK